MSQPRKFEFRTEFAADGSVARAAPKALSNAEIDAKCALAYENGKADALAEAERRAAAALESIGASSTALMDTLHAEITIVRAEAAQVALAAARKIAGRALDAYGAEYAAAAVETAMEALRHHPRLLVKLSPATAEALAPRIEKLRAAHLYEGAILVRGDPALESGDISIDWSDGLIHLDAKSVTERISALIDAALTSS
jgi:flagellar assembly protein FliH